MPRYSDLGEWIKAEHGDQGGLAAALKPKVAKNTVSSWKTGRNGIPPEYQRQLRRMGYDGPWPQEAIQDPTAGSGAFVTREEYGALAARLEAAEKTLKETRDALVGATGAIRQLALKSGSPEIQALLK